MTEVLDGAEVRTIDFTPELDRAYRMYAAKTIEDRALPDVRDGCKPVQRRILYAMYDMGLRVGTPHRKSARIVGEVLGKYHPHGEQSVYGSLVRLAQTFALREVLVDGQGNFGSIDGDSAAAMRYTEARLSPLGQLVLQDIDAETVNVVDNFDGSLTEPTVLPSAFPNLLVNGATGIAVGMATNIPPHNLGEVSSAIQHVVTHWKRRDAITTDELMEHVPGPDFPTGGIVYRYREDGGEVVDTIHQAYDLGHGRIVTQARMNIEEIGGGKTNIVISELPYTVQTTTVLERIAKEVRDGRIAGVTDLRDESDYDTGMRVVVEVSRAARADHVMVALLKHSQLQETFGCHNLALVPDAATGGVRPRRLTLREMLVHFISFRLEVIERRTRHELERREARQHIVQGLLKALASIDEVVSIIKKSRDADAARLTLEKTLRLSEIQARAILDMPLRRLTALETSELKEEQKALAKRIAYLRGLLESEAQRLDVVSEETAAIREAHATPRRTFIVDSPDTVAGMQVVTETDLVLPEERQIVLLTTAGVERRDASGFRYERTDGITTRATTSQLQQLRVEPEDTVLFVSSGGRAWRNGVGFVPGKATFDMLGLEKEEAVVCAARLDEASEFLVTGTLGGKLKRTRLEDIAHAPGTWSRVVGFAANDDGVLFASLAGAGAHVVFVTEGAQVLRVRTGDVNPQASGTARGVAGIGLKKGDRLLTGAVLRAEELADTFVFIVSATGWCKRVPLDEFPVQGRGSRGVRVLNATAVTGSVAASAVGPATAGLDVLFENGRRFHVDAADVPLENRYNRGRRLFDPKEAEAPVVGAVVI